MLSFDKIENKTVWLTGAAGGLGIGIAQALVDNGFDIAIHYHKRKERAEKLAAKLSKKQVKVEITSGDLSDPKIARKSINRICNKLSPPYALIHSAGSFHRATMFDHSSLQFKKMIDGNLTSFFETAKAVIPHMRRFNSGRIVALGMANAQHTIPMRLMGPHLAAKSGLVALARTLAIEEARNGITVNVVNPGRIDHKELPREKAYLIPENASYPIGHHGSFEDIADATLFLLSPEATYITGAVLDVTGGWMGDDWNIQN